MHFTTILSTLSLASAVLAQLPVLTFDCADNLQEICANMCWGAYCTRPAFGRTLYYDQYGGTKKRASIVGRRRQTTAGCLPRPNRCSSVTGRNCDEYPFASTAEADLGGQVSKCVPSRQNSRQGQIIGNFLAKSCGGQPCRFTISFGNPSKARYCTAYTDPSHQCVNDMSQPIFKNGAPDVQPVSVPPPIFSSLSTPASLFSGIATAQPVSVPPPIDSFPSTVVTFFSSIATRQPAPSRRGVEDLPIAARFLMQSGMEVILPFNTTIGVQTKRPVPQNATLKAWVEENDEDEELIEWDFADDTVMAKLD